jgi:hypothetical protein
MPSVNAKKGDGQDLQKLQLRAPAKGSRERLLFDRKRPKRRLAQGTMTGYRLHENRAMAVDCDGCALFRSPVPHWANELAFIKRPLSRINCSGEGSE